MIDPDPTRPWRPGSIPRADGDPGRAEFDFGRSRHLPRLARVSPWHVRWYPPRVLEPEVMDAEDETGAYMDAAAAEHLTRLDAGWAEFVARTGPRGPARVLDVGTGGGQIPALLARRRADFGEMASAPRWTAAPLAPDPAVSAWTDDFHNLLSVFKW